MGYGDFKLLAALGAWLGWQSLPTIVLLSSVVGALVGISLVVFGRHNRSVPIPFGPYLAAAAWLPPVFGKQISTAYLQTLTRSEERLVGKGCVRTFRSRGCPIH